MDIGFKTKNEKIVEIENKNCFGVQFQCIKTIRDFQKKSGMSGPFKTEYQYHYVNFVGRLVSDDQVLDIAIPAVLFNYEQEVTGAHIDFNLEDVAENNEKAMALAVKKFDEFSETEMFKELSAMGISDWTIEGMNTNHMHPQGVNSFSGVDLRKDVSHPGVVYPLSTGDNVSSFSGMMQHRAGNNAEQIIMQYRLFNDLDDGTKLYERGRCLCVVRGYKPPEEKPQEPIPDGVIDKIFGTKRHQPVKKEPELPRESYFIEDGFEDADQETLNATKDALMTMWEHCNFMPDTSMVLKENIIRDAWKKKKKTTYKGNQTVMWGDDWYETPKKTNSKELSLSEVEQYLRNEGFEWKEIKEMRLDEKIETYRNLKELNEQIAEEEKMSRAGALREEIINLISGENIIREEKLEQMSDHQLISLAKEIYGDDIIPDTKEK